jgi:hypothetical protein
MRSSSSSIRPGRPHGRSGATTGSGPRVFARVVLGPSRVKMLVIWRANFSGSKEQLAKVTEKLKELGAKHGERVEGPFYAQDADLLWLSWTKSGNIGESGREFLPWVQEAKIPIEPVRWEVALTEKEFWG